MNEGNRYFASFYFRVWDLTPEIRENKNPAKISTYTVPQGETSQNAFQRSMSINQKWKMHLKMVISTFN